MGRGWKPGVELENVMSLSRIEGHSTLLMLASVWPARNVCKPDYLRFRRCTGLSDVDSQQMLLLTIASHDAL